MPEAVVWLAAVAPKAGALIDSPRRHQNIVGPQGDSPIADTPGESQTLVDEPGSDTGSARGRLHDQQPQLRGVLCLSGGAEHATHPLTVQLGDPRCLALAVAAFGEVGDDARDEGLERRVPAILRRVPVAMPLDHPAQVAGRGRAKKEAP